MKIKVVSCEKETPNGGNKNQNAGEHARATPPRTLGYGCHLLMTSALHTVLPAPAGIQFAASGTADARHGIPAFAGMTCAGRNRGEAGGWDSRLRGKDGAFQSGLTTWGRNAEDEKFSGLWQGLPDFAAGRALPVLRKLRKGWS